MKRLFGTILLMFFLGVGLSGCKPAVSFKDPLDKTIPRIPVKDWHRPNETLNYSLSDEEKQEKSEYGILVLGVETPLRPKISPENLEKLRRWDKYIADKDELVREKKDASRYKDLPDVRPGMTVRDAIADLDAFEKKFPAVGAADFKKAEEAAERYSKSPESKKPLPPDPNDIQNCKDKSVCGGAPGHPDARKACYFAISPSVNGEWKPVDDMITAPLPGFVWANKKPNDFWITRRENDILIQNEYGGYIRHSVTCFFNKKTGETKIVFKRL